MSNLDKDNFLRLLQQILDDLLVLRCYYCDDDEETKYFTGLVMQVTNLIDEVNNYEI